MPQIAGFRGALWDPTKVEVARVAAGPIENPKERLARGELVRDPSRAMYRYHQTFTLDGRKVTRKTFLCAFKLSPWKEGVVRPHEATDPEALALAKQQISAAGAHCEPVFAGYRDAPGELDRLMRNAENEKPVLDVTTADGTQHRLWRVSSAEVIGKLRPLFAPKKLHILDGHARYEAMLAYHEQLAARGELMTYSSANYALGCLINVTDPALVVTARHRVLRGTGKQASEVLAAAQPTFIVEKLAGAAKDAVKLRSALDDTLAHQPAFVAVFAGDADAYKLTLSPDVTPTSEGVQVHRAVQKYDPVVVEHLFVQRQFAGAKSATETDSSAVVARVAAGADVGIITRPLTVEQVLHTDELAQTLPFGSTAFPPQLANLVVYFVDPDEDLV